MDAPVTVRLSGFIESLLHEQRQISTPPCRRRVFAIAPFNSIPNSTPPAMRTSQ